MDKDDSMEQRILDAAENLFLEKGFALTSTTEIAKVAGCNQALIHYYYRTKEKLFESVFHQKILLFMSSFMQTEETGLSFTEKLKRKIESHFNVLYENQQLPFLFINELSTNPSRVKAIKDSFLSEPPPFFRQFSQELEEEIREGRIRAISAIDLALTVFSLNATVFLTKSVLMGILSIDDSEFNNFARKRLEENITIIMRRISL